MACRKAQTDWEQKLVHVWPGCVTLPRQMGTNFIVYIITESPFNLFQQAICTSSYTTIESWYSCGQWCFMHPCPASSLPPWPPILELGYHCLYWWIPLVWVGLKVLLIPAQLPVTNTDILSLSLSLPLSLSPSPFVHGQPRWKKWFLCYARFSFSLSSLCG